MQKIRLHVTDRTATLTTACWAVSRNIHQMCIRTDLYEYITVHTEQVQIMTGEDNLGG
jgi:hypothetical protein